MPKSIDYITDKSYMKGTNFFGDKRVINTVEFGLLYHSIDTNIVGMQLMKSFAQCAKDEDVKKYFKKGQELSKEIIKGTNDILLQNNIQSSNTSGGIVTSSTEAPFSEKLMMFCTYLLGGFGLGGQGFSAGFLLRNDMMMKTAVFAKDVYEYIVEGARLMMSKGWLEEPPKMQR